MYNITLEDIRKYLASVSWDDYACWGGAVDENLIAKTLVYKYGIPFDCFIDGMGPSGGAPFSGPTQRDPASLVPVPQEMLDILERLGEDILMKYDVLTILPELR